MLNIVVFCFLLTVYATIDDESDLMMVFLVHRHGDRTPTLSTIKYSPDPVTLVNLTKPYGYGQLTEKGKRRSYKLGEFIRKRYDNLLGDQYNSSNVYIRSTDFTRTKMTILTALAAVYPPGRKKWSDTIHWTPVPYTTVPVKYDFISINSSLPKYIAKLMPQMHKAATKALDVMFEGVNASLEAGVLLEEFLHYSSLIISGIDTEKVRIYSAHDYNVYAFQIVTRASPRQGVPKFASAYALELRRVKSTGQFLVLPVYLPQPDEELVYLEVKDCGKLCDYNMFVSLTKGDALDYDIWHEKCGFHEDFHVDTSE
ncbi:prostatic acid phosphatase [Amyelois transitella]|uniref:prostatic acid phosphatase n=1 Tax=Amyelois transitella TaxID=680683 RepID=UPI002990074A|nr:prostatic acid phosphatase [Amyelois transitella]